MAESMPYQLAVGNFQTDQDDFKDWVGLFEAAIELAYPSANAEARKGYCLRWLPLKLDTRARNIYQNVTEVDWEDKKIELAKLLVNPEERYNWLARRTTIVWDGKESLHTLATRIVQAVNKYDPKNGDKEREYFFRFRAAMPLEYKKAIDMNCGEDRPTLCTIAQAKIIACRLQGANAEVTVPPGVIPVGKTVAFAGAAMSDDRLKAVELGLQQLRLESNSTKNRGSEDSRRYGRHDSRELHENHRGDDRFRNSGDSQDWQGDRHDNRYRNYNNERSTYDNDHCDRRDRRDRADDCYYEPNYHYKRRYNRDYDNDAYRKHDSQEDHNRHHHRHERAPSPERQSSHHKWDCQERRPYDN